MMENPNSKLLMVFSVPGVECVTSGHMDKKHSTAEHKHKERPGHTSTATASPTGNLAASEGFSGGLQLMQGFL